MMDVDYGMSDAEEREVFGTDEECDYDEGYDVDRKISEMKESGTSLVDQLLVRHVGASFDMLDEAMNREVK
jgi:hypothetical protein|tara:strand:- start:3138 stop:3350 length:213 start_codon:yes stop_codon:yes gene_type:complete